MPKTVGIRYEDKYALEKRVPLVPADVEKLVEKGLKIEVQTSEKRIFKDNEYSAAGAEIVKDMSNSDIILGVKEVTLNSFEENKTYIFFSHVIKGQQYNMPMLRKMMEKKINLIDYEKVTDEKGRRLIFFGNYAGLAGMIDTLWALGQRLEYSGIITPFLKLKQSRMYNSLEDAKSVLRSISAEISEKGLPEELCPFTVGFAGYGNVSKGAQEIFDILPFEEIQPSELPVLDKTASSSKKLYKIIFKEEHLAEKKDGTEFELQEYYVHPERFKGVFEKYLPRLSVLMNCVYWTDKYPKLVTKNYLKHNFSSRSKLIAIGDITCDVNGSIECTELGTPIDDPVYIYNTKNGTHKMGHEGEGLLIMSVDILPSELPRESSEFFSKELYPFMESIAQCDFSVPFGELIIANEIKRALILLNGEFTPNYEYLTKYLK